MIYRKLLNDIKPYKPGRQIKEIQNEYGVHKVIKLASNENPYGCSKKVAEVFKNYKMANLYPDNNCTDLKEKLSNTLGTQKENLVFGNGSTEIIGMLSRAILNKGDEIITCIPTFPMYVTEAKIAEAKIVEVPLKDFKFDLDGILQKINKNTKIIYIANPNNPTGTIVTKKEQELFLEKVPKDIFVVIDEAYYDYVTNEDYPDTMRMLEEYRNVIILRTFSKAYGIASLRIGYGIADKEIIQNLEKVKNPFNVTSISMEVAKVALGDREFVQDGIAKNQEVLEYVYNELNKRHIEYIQSNANFVFINTKKDGNKVFQKLLRKGIIVRPGFQRMDSYIRVTIGTLEEMKEFILKLEEIM